MPPPTDLLAKEMAGNRSDSGTDVESQIRDVHLIKLLFCALPGGHAA